MVYESIDHGIDVTRHTVPVVLFLVFRKKKCYCKKQIDHNFPWSTLLLPEYSTFYDVTSMVYKSVDHGKLMRFAKWTGGLPRLHGVPHLHVNRPKVHHCTYPGKLSFHKLCSSMQLHNTTYARNSSLGYHHVVSNGKTKHTS